MRKLIALFIAYALLCHIDANAQSSSLDPQLQKVVALIHKLQAAGTASPYSCQVEYRYSNASEPGVVLESKKGTMTVDSSRYCRIIGNTEMLHNDRYDITVFNEDSLIYVTNAAVTPQGAQPLGNLMAMLKDSLLTGCTVNSKGAAKTIRFLFHPNASCKSMEVVADTVSMRVMAVNMEIRTSLMMNGAEPGEGYEEYAMMSVLLSGYQPLKPAAVAAIFDEKRYFHKTDKSLVPAATYAGYQVFSGSPQLQ
ncbi:hypothetical protein SAMN04488128_105142 [Chitinophaga eiseniae]|uniref:Outer membrane lipoprotein-sorting protein n=1 Tax=Chitinophaga eiseniae TaxID=634771 RepID=A0A1T4TIS3_9BACT|nr:hypothetical protein [Chitinophaga eiseniae]SKA40208.1 hypothetical protein SAMN04488128_105142 [Chitinophaga eiseniae]